MESRSSIEAYSESANTAPNLKYLGIVFVFAALAYIFVYHTIFSLSELRSYWAFYIEQTMLFACIAALAYRVVKEQPGGNRRFWILLSVAHIFYLTAYIADASNDWYLSRSVRTIFIDNTINLFYYAAIFLAGVNKPHLAGETKPTSMRRWVEITAIAVFSIALFSYVVVIPIAAASEGLSSYGHSSILYAVMDAVIAVYFLLLAREASGSRWTLIYVLLAFDSLIWAGLDVFEAAIFYEILSYAPGGLIDGLWLVPYVALITAICIKPANRAPGKIPKRDVVIPMPAWFQSGHLIVLWIVALPLLHFVLNATGAVDPSIKASRELAVLVFGVLLGVLAVVDNQIRNKEKESVLLRLRRSQKQEELGRLAGQVAHDFKNVLTVINGYADIILTDGKSGDWMADRIRKIQQAGDDATQLADQLLTFSRKTPLQPEVLDLNALVSELSKMLKRVMGDDIELSVNLDPDLGKVFTDRSQIEHVLMNLVVNSKDAMPGGGKLTIETKNEAVTQDMKRRWRTHETECIVLTVTDTGFGMDEETQSRAFDPFFTTKDSGHGPGLGLSVALGIVEQHGGNLQINSDRSGGTRVVIYLPRAQLEAITES